MAPFSKHQSARFTKLLLIGDSGTGKTGSLLSLVKAGYKLRILDLDNGLDILRNMILQECPDKIDNVDFITVTDKFKQVGGKSIPVDSTAWSRSMEAMVRWSNLNRVIGKKSVPDPTKPGETKVINDTITKEHPDFFDLGEPATWGEDTILVIDSFTFACNAAMRFILKLNGRPAGPVYESDWLEAQTLVENFLAMLYDESFRTNIIVCAHIAVRVEKDGTTTAFPAALGKALGPKVGRYFNSMLEVRRTGSNATVTRSIHTVPAGLLELKNSNPLGVLPKYDIKDGLAKFFEAVRK